MKVGQHIASLDYLLPREYVSTFKVFHSSAPSTPLHRLKRVIFEEFGVPGKERKKRNRERERRREIFHLSSLSGGVVFRAG